MNICSEWTQKKKKKSEIKLQYLEPGASYEPFFHHFAVVVCNAFDIHVHALLLQERPPLLLWWIFFHSGVMILRSSFSTENPSQEYNCNISTGLWCTCCGCPPPEVFLHGGSRAKTILHCRAILWHRLRLTLKKALEQISSCVAWLAGTGWFWSNSSLNIHFGYLGATFTIGTSH